MTDPECPCKETERTLSEVDFGQIAPIMGCESSKSLDALQDAIKRDDDEALRRLIREGADVNTYFRNGHHTLKEAMVLHKPNCFKVR